MNKRTKVYFRFISELKKKKLKKKIPFLAENVCITMWEMVQSKEQYFFYYHEQKLRLGWLLPEGMGGS